MEHSIDVAALEARIGYTFCDKSLLVTALTNRSYTNEHGGECNERLEFLGDSVLGLVVTEQLYRDLPDGEGELSVLRARTVSREPLARATDALGLVRFYRLGKGAGAQAAAGKEKFRANLFEAVLGAVYLDGGLQKAAAFVREHLLSKDYLAAENAKTLLQEKLATRGVLPDYRTFAQEDGFVCELRVSDACYTGTGPNKAQAEQSAAAQVLKALFMSGSEK